MKFKIDETLRQRITGYVLERLKTDDEKGEAFDYIYHNYYPDKDGVEKLIEYIKERFKIDFSEFGAKAKKPDIEDNENIIIKFPEEIKNKALTILKEGEPLAYIKQVLDRVHVGDDLLKILVYLTGLTASIEGDQLHVMLTGMSGKGKSNLFSNVLLAYPQNRYYAITSVSPKSILYSDKELDGKVLYIDEAESSKEAIPILRSLTSSGKIKPTHWSINDNKFTGKTFTELKKKGSWCVWLSSVAPLKDDQLKNRFVMGNPDESIDQDKKVHEYQMERYGTGKQKEGLPECFEIAQCMTEEVCNEKKKVIIPYYKQIEFKNIENRRNYPFFMTLIGTVCYFNRLKRKELNEYLIATKYDFEIANLLWNTIERQQIAKASMKALDLMNYVKDEENKKDITEITKETGLSRTTVRDRLNELYYCGLIDGDVVERKWIYWARKGCRGVATTVDWGSFGEKELEMGLDSIRRESESAYSEDISSLYKYIIENSACENSFFRQWLSEAKLSSADEKKADCLASLPVDSVNEDIEEEIIQIS